MLSPTPTDVSSRLPICNSTPNLALTALRYLIIRFQLVILLNRPLRNINHPSGSIHIKACGSLFCSQHGSLLLVQVPKDYPRQDCSNAHQPRQHAVHDNKPRILCQRAKRQGKYAPKSSHQVPYSLHERLHALWSSVICVLSPCRAAKDGRKLRQEIEWKLDADADLIGHVSARSAGEGVVVARPCPVDEVLDNDSVSHGYGQKAESEGDARDGAEADTTPGQEGVQAVLDDGADKNTGNGSGDHDHIIWNTISDHLPRLGDEIVERLVETEPVDREYQAGK